MSQFEVNQWKEHNKSSRLTKLQPKLRGLATREAMESAAMVDSPPPPTTTTGNSTPRIFGNDSLSKRISQFQSAAEKNSIKQKQNPFSGSFECASLRGKFNKDDPR